MFQATPNRTLVNPETFAGIYGIYGFLSMTTIPEAARSQAMQSKLRTHWGPPLTWSGNVRRILVVEDDPDQTLLLKDYLESYFYGVTVVHNGVEALKAILEADYDAILCDLVMPKMAGDMFYRAVERVKSYLCERFIFITAHPDNPRVKEFLNHAGGQVLMKPFHLDDLLEMILLLFRELDKPVNKLPAPGEMLMVRPLQPGSSRPHNRPAPSRTQP
jgi:CheY-like chemotaxis protein